MPIACVDFVPILASGSGCQVGLIERDSPFGRVWCHLGGRIRRGESVRSAILRHLHDTLAVGARLPEDPQPAVVFQWFPPQITPQDVPAHGQDPRKHAIGLSFLIEVDGTPKPRNEALSFAYVDPLQLPSPMWPGSATLIERLLRSR